MRTAGDVRRNGRVRRRIDDGESYRGMTTALAHGGHHLVLDGAPTAEVEVLPAPAELRLPRRHRFVRFSNLAVAAGETVGAGQVLATGPAEHEFPLVAPAGGLVAEVTDEVIVLTVRDATAWTGRAFEPLAWRQSSADALGRRIRDAGLWPTLYAAPDGEIPWRHAEDDRTPAFVVIGAARGEPHLADPALVLDGRAGALAEAADILRRVSGAARVVCAVATDLPPLDVPNVEFLRLETRAPHQNVLVQCDAVARGTHAWGIDVQDALAIRDAVVDGALPADRLITLAGGLVHRPKHLRVKVGTPLRDIIRDRLRSGRPRILSGGLLSGNVLDQTRDGVPPWTTGLNVIPEPQEREFLSFMRLGGDRDSYLALFLSSLTPHEPRTGHTGLRGERRACVNCTACQWVCPVDLIPSTLWKYCRHDMVDEAVALGVRRCVECGLCSYVCPSKIELVDTFRKAHADLRADAAEERALRAAEA